MASKEINLILFFRQKLTYNFKQEIQERKKKKKFIKFYYKKKKILLILLNLSEKISIHRKINIFRCRIYYSKF